MAEVLTAMDLAKGTKLAKWKYTGTAIQPIQMLKKQDKTVEWKEANMDWMEYIGTKQIRSKAQEIIRMYQMANGVIDRNDYMPDNPETGELIDILNKGIETTQELRFFPLVPTIVNTLSNEFANRTNKVIVKALDEYSTNERLMAKFERVKEAVVSKAQMAFLQKQIENGIDVSDEQIQEQLQKQVQSLPEIQEFFNKNYRTVAEQWGNHELNLAEQRFTLFEKENEAFRDYLITDQEFWHIGFTKDDYFVELWHPLFTFFHQSPDVKYVSQGNYVGRIMLMSIPDMVDKLGHLMTEEQLKSLESLVSPYYNSSMSVDTGTYMATNFYDPSKPRENQIKSIHYAHTKDMFNTWLPQNSTILNWFQTETDLLSQGMAIVTQAYWRSQKRVGWLKEVKEDGTVFEDFISEDFLVTDEPQYDLSIIKNKVRANVTKGQHIDWMWVNETWGGIKIGNGFTFGLHNTSEFKPIYLNVEALPFQFKGDNTIYGAKLPVEGITSTDRLIKNNSLVRKLAPDQIGYNFVRNQIMDLLADEVGNVILFDQNAIPKQSLDGSWGKYNFAKAYQVMKNFQILPVDTSLQNNENGANFQHFQQVALHKTEMLTSRMKLAEFFRNEALNIIGISPQRLADVGKQETATGVEAAINNSYMQTEHYFLNHMQFLMPRVKQMILNAAQYINSTKENVRIEYLNSDLVNEFFEVEGIKLLLPDLGVFCMNRPNTNNIVKQMKEFVIQNNTLGGNIQDYLTILNSDSASEIVEKAQNAIERMRQDKMQDQEHEKQMLQMELESKNAQDDKNKAFTAEENEKDRIARITEAQIRASANFTNNDMNNNNIPDPFESDRFIQETNVTNEELLLKREAQSAALREKAANYSLKEKELLLKQKDIQSKEKLKKEELANDRKNMANDLLISRQNAKNRSKKTK